MESNDRFASSSNEHRGTPNLKVANGEDYSLSSHPQPPTSAAVVEGCRKSTNAAIVDDDLPPGQRSPAEVLAPQRTNLEEQYGNSKEMNKVVVSSDVFHEYDGQQNQLVDTSKIAGAGGKDDVSTDKSVHNISPPAMQPLPLAVRTTPAVDSSSQTEEYYLAATPEARELSDCWPSNLDEYEDEIGLELLSQPDADEPQYRKYYQPATAQSERAREARRTQDLDLDYDLLEKESPSFSVIEVPHSVNELAAGTARLIVLPQPLAGASSPPAIRDYPVPSTSHQPSAISTVGISSIIEQGGMAGFGMRNVEGREVVAVVEAEEDGEYLFSAEDDGDQVARVTYEEPSAQERLAAPAVASNNNDHNNPNRELFTPFSKSGVVDVDRDARLSKVPQDAHKEVIQQQTTLGFADDSAEKFEVGTMRNSRAIEVGTLPNRDAGGGSGCSGHSGTQPGRSRIGRSGSLGDGGCGPFSLSKQQVMIGPASTFSQVLHVVLALVVLALVSIAKAGDGVPHMTCGRAAESIGRPGFSSGRRSIRSGEGGERESRRRSPGLKRQRSGSLSGIRAQSWSLVCRVRAAWSKVWHATENVLASRWRAAGQVLAALRQAWAALWLPRPHTEADVLAEALASPRYCRAGDGGSGVHGTGSKPAGWERACGDGKGSDAREPVGSKFLRLCGYRPLPTSGSGRGSRSPKFLLVLDLDETLVHCSPDPCGTPRGPSRGPRGSRGKTAVCPDLKVELRGIAPSYRPACMYAWKRPHLDVFLGVVSRWYEIAVFTSGTQCFAEPLIDLIDSRLVIGKRFYRDSCTRRDRGRLRDGDRIEGAVTSSSAGPETMKDLSVLHSEHFPLRTVLVDNQPRTVVQQANVLPVKSWYPEDSGDRQLLDLLPVLLALTSCCDVRSVLGLRPGVTAMEDQIGC